MLPARLNIFILRYKKCRLEYFRAVVECGSVHLQVTREIVQYYNIS